MKRKQVWGWALLFSALVIAFPPYEVGSDIYGNRRNGQGIVDVLEDGVDGFKSGFILTLSPYKEVAMQKLALQIVAIWALAGGVALLLPKQKES